MPTRPREPEFQDHGSCLTLTNLALQQTLKDPSTARKRRYAAGEYVWQDGDPATHLYILQRGRIWLVDIDRQANERFIRTIEAGEPFGELCFCAESRHGREESARAQIDSEVLDLDFRALITHLQKSGEAMGDLIATMCRRLSDSDRRIEALSFRGAEERLGRLLLHLARSEGKQSGELITLPQSHEELALLSSMSRSHVSVTMGKLRKAGLIHYGRGLSLRIDVASLLAFLDKRSGEPAERPSRKKKSS